MLELAHAAAHSCSLTSDGSVGRIQTSVDKKLVTTSKRLLLRCPVVVSLVGQVVKCSLFFQFRLLAAAVAPVFCRHFLASD